MSLGASRETLAGGASAVLLDAFQGTQIRHPVNAALRGNFRHPVPHIAHCANQDTIQPLRLKVDTVICWVVLNTFRALHAPLAIFRHTTAVDLAFFVPEGK